METENLGSSSFFEQKSIHANICARLDDTICPVDFESHGQIDSDTLHKAIVSPMIREARLTVLFDCCHSGSAIELPYVYRPDSHGQVNLVDNVKQGINLASSAVNLLRGGL